MTRKILGVVPGLEFQKRKGSAFIRVFQELEKEGRLAGLVDVSLPRIVKWGFRIRNFSWNIERWNTKNQLDILRYRAASRIARKALEDVSVDFDAVIQIGSNIDISNVLKRKQKKCFSFHDNNVASYIAQLPTGIVNQKKIRLALDFENNIYVNNDGVLSMSRTLANSFVDNFGLPEQKVHYVGFGTSFEGQNIKNKDYSSKKLLFVATHSFEKKGGETVLSAFRKLREKISDAELIIVGREWDINQEGVTVIGFLDKRVESEFDIYKSCFESASVFVLPSQIEAFGEVFIEAMSYGLPCIGSTRGVMPEIISDNRAGEVIEPNDSDELSKILIEWFSNPSHLREMGEAGYSAANREYTWRNVSERIVEVVDSSFGQ